MTKRRGSGLSRPTTIMLMMVDALTERSHSPIIVTDLESALHALKPRSLGHELRVIEPARLLLDLRQLKSDGLIERVTGLQGGYRLTDQGRLTLREAAGQRPDVQKIKSDISEAASKVVITAA